MVAKVNEKLQIQKIDVWFDPMAMFRQMQDGEGAKKAMQAKQAAAEQEKQDAEKLNAE